MRRNDNLPPAKATKPFTTEQRTEIVQYLKDRPRATYKELFTKFPYTSTTRILNLKKELGIHRQIDEQFDQQSLLQFNQRRCPKCKIVKSLDDFYPYTLSRCRYCENERGKLKAKKRIETAFETVEGALKWRLRETLVPERRKEGHDHNITIEYLLKLFRDQKGLCFYTGKTLAIATNTVDTVSIDRIDSGKGYVEGNIALCRLAINLMKRAHTTDDFIQLCRDVVKYADQ